jgi:hypothetical protein
MGAPTNAARGKKALANSEPSTHEGIVLQKPFWGGDQNFSGPLMPFARGDMRDHIVLHKNDHGASYGRYAVLQWWSRLKISFCEIFGVVQFSTFATLSRVERTCIGSAAMSANDPNAT